MHFRVLPGPDIADGSFKPVAVKSIHYKRCVGSLRGLMRWWAIRLLCASGGGQLNQAARARPHHHFPPLAQPSPRPLQAFVPDHDHPEHLLSYFFASSHTPLSLGSTRRLPVGRVVAGQTAALALKKIKRGAVRKGMALVDEKAGPAAVSG